MSPPHANHGPRMHPPCACTHHTCRHTCCTASTEHAHTTLADTLAALPQPSMAGSGFLLDYIVHSIHGVYNTHTYLRICWTVWCTLYTVYTTHTRIFESVGLYSALYTRCIQHTHVSSNLLDCMVHSIHGIHTIHTRFYKCTCTGLKWPTANMSRKPTPTHTSKGDLNFGLSLFGANILMAADIGGFHQFIL